MTTLLRIALGLLLLAGGLCCGKASDEGSPEPEWPQWRGPQGLGVSAELDLPMVWSPGSPNTRWQTEVPGVGNSSPIVSSNKVFLTSWDGKDAHMVLCFDWTTGELLWTTPVPVPELEATHPLSTPAAATPAADGQNVFVYFGSTLASLDYEGNIAWQMGIDPAYYKYPYYGAAASPVLSEDMVIVIQDRELGDTEDVGWLAAFDKKTGKEIWRDEWSHTCCSYDTPILIKRGSDHQLITAKPAEVVGYDARTGEHLWKYKHDRMIQNVPSMVALGEVVYAVGGVHSPSTFALRLSGNGKGTKPELLWEKRRGQPKTASPVAYEGMLFMVTELGVMSNFDALTGKLLWRKRLPGGDFHASLVAGDGKVYARNAYGITVVVRAARKFELLSENRIYEEDTNPKNETSSPVLVDGAYLIRSKSRLFRIDREQSL